MINADNATSDLTPKHLSKQEFGRRLYRMMTAKGWHQSELSRRSGLQRAAISTYINGRVFPTESSLKALADAFGVTPDEILPNRSENAIAEDALAFEMKVSPSAPNTAWVKVNRLVTLSTAVKIAELLERDDVINRTGSGSTAAMQHVESEKAADDGEVGVLQWTSGTHSRN